jgi:hypothetical protein
MWLQLACIKRRTDHANLRFLRILQSLALGVTLPFFVAEGRKIDADLCMVKRILKKKRERREKGERSEREVLVHYYLNKVVEQISNEITVLTNVTSCMYTKKKKAFCFHFEVPSKC